MEPDKMLFLDGWKFFLDVDSAHNMPSAANMRPVELPHDWQIESHRDREMPGGGAQGFYPREGVGWYARDILPEDGWRGRRVRLRFDGVQRFCTVYLNGRELGGHMYGYVPFEVELTDALEFGRMNTLMVKVDNSPDPAPTCAIISREDAEKDARDYALSHGLAEDALLREYSCGGDRWYSGAGIYRNVWLLIDDAVSIAPRGMMISPDISGDVAVELRLDNTGADYADVRVELEITAPDGSAAGRLSCDCTAAPGISAQCFALHVDAPERWDVDSPALYTMNARVFAGGQSPDEAVSRFGFREAHFDTDKGFFLNGRMLKLYGADLHHDGGAFGAAMPMRVLKRRLLALRSMGCNAIRCSHNPHGEELYELCDELGMIVIDELYDKWAGTGLYYQRLFLRDWRDDLERMVRRDYNHPSIVLWSMGNEVDIQYSEAFYSILGEMCARCRELDPHRPVSAALIGFCLRDFNDSTPLDKRLAVGVRYGELVDVFMGNYMEGFYDALREAGLHKAFIGSEVLSYYRQEDLQVTNILARSPWRDVDEKDYVAGGFVWAGVDYIGESTGWPCHGWTGCPIDSAGFLKLRAHHLKAQWSKEPMVRIGVYDEGEPWDMANYMWSFPQMSGHWNYDCPGKMMHVAVMTNCDSVELYLNGSAKRVARPDSDDRLAHFYLSFAPGTLRAVGIRDGKPVCEQVLRTARFAERLEINVCEDDMRADGRDIAHVEVRLLDKYGQRFEQLRVPVSFRVEGPADVMRVDNGDFLTTDEVFTAEKRTLFHGQALAILRSRTQPGRIRVTAMAEGFAPVSAELESR